MSKGAVLEVEDQALLRAEAAWSLAGAGIEAAFARGRGLEALEGIEALIAQDPERGWAYALRGEVKRSPSLGRFSEALEDMERASVLSPDLPWIMGYKAKALAQSGKASQADEILARALELAPQSPWLLAERSLLRLAGAESSLGVAEAFEACKLDPESAQAHLAFAACLAKCRRLEEALEAADKSLELRANGPKDFAVEGSPLPRLYELRFEILRGLGRCDKAAESLRLAAQEGERLVWAAPEVSDPEALGISLGELGSVPERRGLKAWICFWRGDVRMRLGRLAEAEEDFTKALAADPRHLCSWAWRGRCRILAGAFSKALRDLSRALELAEAEGWLPEWRVLLLRAESRLGLKKWRAAIADLSRALDLNPSCSSAHFQRAQAWLALGRREPAERDLRLCLELDPRHGKAYVLRAQLRSGRGNLEGALSDLKHARLAGHSGDPLALGVQTRAYSSPGSSRRVARRGSAWYWAAYGKVLCRPRAKRGKVCVDPRIELAGILQLALTREPVPGFCRRKAPELAAYVEEAQGRLLPFAGLQLLERFQASAAARGNPAFPWLGITQMMMDVSLPPALKPQTPAWRQGEDLCLLRHLRDFVERSRFLEFFDSHSGLFKRWTRPMGLTVEREAYAEAASSYVGVEIDAYYDVIFSPLLRQVSLRAILRSASGSEPSRPASGKVLPVGTKSGSEPSRSALGDALPNGAEAGRGGARTVFCPLSSARHLEDYLLSPKPAELLWTGWHEILHMVVDPWSELQAPEAEPLSRLYERIPRQARRKNWLDCFSEHLVRAATQRLLSLRMGAKAGKALAAQDRDEGYLFAEGLAERLKDYEGARDRYPALLDFFPQWLKAWGEMA